jgi:cell division protein FtsA
VKRGTKSKKEIAMQAKPEDLIFALDIGTRSVVGIVGTYIDDKFKVLAIEIYEHKDRVMQDGQIHDISAVTDVVLAVKNKLSEKLGVNLSNVSIAAAGRVLKTCEVTVERGIDINEEIDEKLISSLEIEGIQKAQSDIEKNKDDMDFTVFYCVGYSIISYYLNGFEITNLVGHKGKTAGVKVLATFLPHVVVDSLYTVMSRAKLEVDSLTLEPIAALNVTIPKELRMLNLALVDIGAGTSDIAITKGGSVVAYGMAPVAGDEITEKIAQEYLVDFNTAEKVKKSLSDKDIKTVKIKDILGSEKTVKCSEVQEKIHDAIDNLSATITDTILDFNHKPPNAVFLIGGGSQVPLLTDMISDKIGLPKDRVVVRNRDVIKDMTFKGKTLSGPEAITPFGIAMTSRESKGHDFLTVTVNGRRIRLFNSKDLTVADTLVLIGYNPRNLIGRSGKSVKVFINDEVRTKRGDPGTAATITVNGENAGLDNKIKPGDNINIDPAKNGKDAVCTVKDFVSSIMKFDIKVDVEAFTAGISVYNESGDLGLNDRLSEGDEIKVFKVITLNDLINHKEIDTEDYTILINGKSQDKDYKLNENDEIELIEIDYYEDEEEIEDIAGKTGVNIEKEEVKRNTAIDLMVNGSMMKIDMNKEDYIFVDVFNYINFDTSKSQGNLHLRLNNNQAAFTDSIKSGDIIEIGWR